VGVERGLIEKSGAWLSYGGERIGQGRENTRVFLKENIAIRDKIEVALRKQLGLVPQAQAGTNGAAPAEKSAAEKPVAERPAASASAAAAGAANANRPRPAR
jgi:recombination protein RecA